VLEAGWVAPKNETSSSSRNLVVLKQGNSGSDALKPRSGSTSRKSSPLQISALDRVPPRAAEDGDWKDTAFKLRAKRDVDKKKSLRRGQRVAIGSRYCAVGIGVVALGVHQVGPSGQVCCWEFAALR